MDISTLSNGDAAQWYDVPGTDGKVQVEIKALKPVERREIMKKCKKRRMYRGQWIEETDDDLLNRMLLHSVVLAWKGIEEKGESYPVTDENKNHLDDNWPAFSNLWNAVVGHTQELDAALTEAERKN